MMRAVSRRSGSTVHRASENRESQGGPAGAPRDQRYDWAYIFGAVCPARGVGAALVLPEANAKALNLHLAEISRRVSPGAHAVVMLDGAGWHQLGGRP
jgi:hypothetical protein